MLGVEAIAMQLDAAARGRQAVPPFTDAEPEFSVETAYAAQTLLVDLRKQRGAAVLGAKLGLTSRAKQEQMNVSRPLYGWLTSDMLMSAGDRLEVREFLHPRAEPELAFILRETPRLPATAASVLTATEAVVGGIEIIDSRYAGFQFRLPDVVADNASAAGFVLGPVALNAERVGDLRLVGCVLRVDGNVVATAAGGAVLGHPAEAVAWLCNELGARGAALPPGAVVLSGALTEAVRLGEGMTVTAEFDGLGSVEVRC